MRLYYGRLLRQMKFFPERAVGRTYFRVQLIKDYEMVGVYKGETIEDVIKQIKADGHQVWGQTALDYVYADTALDYILFRNYLIHEYGLSEQEADDDLNMRNKVRNNHE